MLVDFYEITMANGYLEQGVGDRIAVFDMFFRKIPDGAGFALLAGLEQLIDYLNNLKFTAEDIEYLRGRGIFCAVSTGQVFKGAAGCVPVLHPISLLPRVVRQIRRLGITGCPVLRRI